MQKKIKSVYIHIPFCDSICSYCDFCKYLKNDEWIDKYLIALEKEIFLRYKGDEVETIYVGGGTPSSLSLEQLNKLFNILKTINKKESIEFTFECNIENINRDKLELLYDNGINRLSIGIQTFNKDLLKYLNRNHTETEVFNKIDLAKKIGFKNINIDLIYAIPGQTLDQLNYDIDKFLKLDITHISTYSLIIEPHTLLHINKVNNIDEDLDYEMYKLICNKLKKNGYKHYEISNFAKVGYESKHNLTYWNNEEYYGFGLGASGYIDGTRYDNTKSLNKYLNGKYVSESHKLNINEKIEDEFILGLRKIEGISKESFKKKYNKDIKDIEAVNKLLKENKLLENKKNIYINTKNIYISNDILTCFIN